MRNLQVAESESPAVDIPVDASADPPAVTVVKEEVFSYHLRSLDTPLILPAMFFYHFPVCSTRFLFEGARGGRESFG